MSNKIIEKLKDDSHYYGVVGKQYLSSSDITTLLYEPEKFKEEIQGKEQGIFNAPSPEKEVGKGDPNVPGGK